MDARRGKILRYKADRFGVTFVFALFALQLTILLQAPLVGAALAIIPLALLGILAAPINHNHQHVNVFRARPLNRFFDLFLALQTGVGPYSWVLHHNLGHHLNYLAQPPSPDADESRWARADGRTMGRFEYAVRLLCSHPIDIQRVGRKHPRIHRRYLMMRLPLYALLAGLAWLAPANFLMVFVLAPLLTLFHTCWVTYEHHAGLHAEDPAHASFNRENRVYNFLSQNLGYHTAHHLRPGIHWSLLPEYHASIREKIPPHLVTRAFW
jgi:beta-carotene hydroxylase